MQIHLYIVLCMYICIRRTIYICTYPPIWSACGVLNSIRTDSKSRMKQSEKRKRSDKRSQAKAKRNEAKAKAKRKAKR